VYRTGAQELCETLCRIDIRCEYKRLAVVALRFDGGAADRIEAVAMKISEAFAAQHAFDDPAESLPAYQNQSS